MISLLLSTLDGLAMNFGFSLISSLFCPPPPKSKSDDGDHSDDADIEEEDDEDEVVAAAPFRPTFLQRLLGSLRAPAGQPQPPPSPLLLQRSAPAPIGVRLLAAPAARGRSLDADAVARPLLAGLRVPIVLRPEERASRRLFNVQTVVGSGAAAPPPPPFSFVPSTPFDADRSDRQSSTLSLSYLHSSELSLPCCLAFLKILL